MDSPKWLKEVLQASVILITGNEGIQPHDADEVLNKAAHTINQRFEAALGKPLGPSNYMRGIGPVDEEHRYYEASNERASNARYRWYNQPDQETDHGK